MFKKVSACLMCLFGGILIMLLTSCVNQNFVEQESQPPSLEINESHIENINEKQFYNNPTVIDQLFSKNDCKEARDYIINFLNEKYPAHNFSVVSMKGYSAAFEDVDPLYVWYYYLKDENNINFEAKVSGGNFFDDAQIKGTLLTKYIVDVEDTYQENFYQPFLENELQKTVTKTTECDCVVSVDTINYLNLTSRVYKNAWDFLQDNGVSVNIFVKENLNEDIVGKIKDNIQNKIDRDRINVYIDKTNSFDPDNNYSDLKHQRSTNYTYFSTNTEVLK